MRLVHRTASSFVLCVLSVGCLDRPIEPIDPRRTSVVNERIPPAPTRIDLLLAIDNSASMADKQQILAAAVPELVERLVNPRCVDADGVSSPPPQDPRAKCPTGTRREFNPIEDVNVAVISSSLGDLGTGVCPDQGAHLSGAATREDGTSYTVPGYSDQSFLAWDPGEKRGGEANLASLRGTVADLVRGVGQDGCGYEMQLESVVRFLVDPAPYATVVHTPIEGSSVYQSGTPRDIDQDLLAQRRDFLRPDSLVAVVMLSDENDCSFNPQGVGVNLLDTEKPFLRARAECANDPDDPCCGSCGATPPGCGADLSCQSSDVYRPTEDPIGLRCWEQKRRYGIDFLFPTSRYVNAFTSRKIDPGAIDFAPADPDTAVDNPLFANLSGELVTRRTPELVFFAGIVGVPWQAIARKNDAGTPDLALGYMTTSELEASGLFAAIAGKPGSHDPPTDPFMVESNVVRPGESALLGASPSAPNAINGFDRQITDERGDLQYACVFDLPGPHQSGAGTDCKDSPTSPLCQGDTQIKAKAYPGLRQLDVIRGLGNQGVAASVCPASLEDPSSDVYGYNPAVRSIVDALRGRLDQQCLPRQLHPGPDGQVSCLVIEARHAEGACDCNGVARRPVATDHDAVLGSIAEDPTSDPAWNCFCEVAQITEPDALTACQNDDDITLEQADVHGFCYVDATIVPAIGNEKLVARCPEGEKRAIRFVNQGRTPRGASALVVCADQSSD